MLYESSYYSSSYTLLIGSALAGGVIKYFLAPDGATIDAPDPFGIGDDTLTIMNLATGAPMGETSAGQAAGVGLSEKESALGTAIKTPGIGGPGGPVGGGSMGGGY